MTQTTIKTQNIAAIGEEIGLDLGKQMVKAYQDANPTDVSAYLIGRNILEQILAQPGCVGIRFYNAYNELGQKTLVYVGVDANESAIITVTSVTTTGEFETTKGIVADRIRPIRTEGIDADDWGVTND